MKKIALIANCGKPDAASVLRRAEVCADNLGLELFCCNETIELLSSARRIPPQEMHRHVDAVMALGGDGTLLETVRLLQGADIPVMGVNLGSLGFMTSLPEESLELAMKALRDDGTEQSYRTMIECSVERKGRSFGSWVALNDVVLGWGTSSRIVSMDICVGGENVLTSMCDGLIISTPTGSTGHSLSAGGPIVHPESSVFAISIVCPHTFSNRPLAIPDTYPIDVKVKSLSKSILVAVDGIDRHELQQDDIVKIRKNPQSLRLLHLPEYSYFEILKQKLHWRGSVV